jgi:hypothetical protein
MNVVEPNTTNTPSQWEVIDGFIAAYTDVFEEHYSKLGRLLNEWDQVLESFGNDPTHIDWSHFRPLRLTREEDWADWLAFLIEQSRTGTLAYSLFHEEGMAPDNYVLPQAVEREVSHGEYRADLIIKWRSGCRAHIEVKVGDENLQKTFATSRVMRLAYGQSPENWSNYILLLSHQLPDWHEIQRDDVGEPPVTVLTWIDVSIALRKALLSQENVMWKAWAYCFLGCIEQILVGYPGHRFRNRPVERLDAKIDILSKGMGGD